MKQAQLLGKERWGAVWAPPILRYPSPWASQPSLSSLKRTDTFTGGQDLSFRNVSLIPNVAVFRGLIVHLCVFSCFFVLISLLNFVFDKSQVTSWFYYPIMSIPGRCTLCEWWSRDCQWRVNSCCWSSDPMSSRRSVLSWLCIGQLFSDGNIKVAAI